ncbi:PEP-CTERM sorting domain-containing protein [Xylophilus sp. GOD-11R]|uniref:PEP-CTERM sorting domain-containing protein n=1 Tax=Xylophilus sp. GOD-11R TaxID=3089814 RepID=UPI00298CE123|nr:PEP-CTERM sorting domain-containing protein [Xylophilus sp. GOD-11R]WPB57993.1 PEP-CTERM sorting domain-containing protein [Xylophilus sp. GOD-11R]
MKSVFLILSAALTFSTAQASLVTSITGQKISFPELTDPYVDEYQVTSEITWTGENSLFGYSGLFGFNDNGTWDGTPAYTVAGGLSSAYVFSFSNPVAAVGGILNSISEEYAYMAIFDSNYDFIEDYDLSINNSTGAGEFHGFQRPTNEISHFLLGGGHIALRDLTIAYAPLAAVPEPETYALLLAGLGLVSTAARRRAKHPALTT